MEAIMFDLQLPLILVTNLKLLISMCINLKQAPNEEKPIDYNEKLLKNKREYQFANKWEDLKRDG